MNAYVYVYDGPLKYFDPSGLVCTPLGRAYIGSSWTKKTERWEPVFEYSFQAPGPGEFGPENCIPIPEPPKKGGWLPRFPEFPCDLPIDLWLYEVKLWKITSFLETWAKYSFVYRCVDDCTGDVEHIFGPEKVELIDQNVLDITWHLERSATPLF